MRRVCFALVLATGACSLTTDFSGIEDDGMRDDWLAPGIASRKRLTLDTTVTSIDLQDVPLAVVITDPDLASAGFADGRDIAFTAADGVTKLAHEIEHFDGGSLVAWVKVPSIIALTPVDIFLYFGNPDATDQQNVTGTWSAGYRGVWHLSQDPAAPGAPMLDSTATGKHGAAEGNPQSVPGIVANALSFDGDDRLVMEDAEGALDFQDNESFSFSLWALVTTYTNGGDTLLQRYHAGVGWLIDMQPGEYWSAGVFNGEATTYATLGADTEFLGRWSHLVCVVDREHSNVHVYAHGAFAAESPLTVGSVVSPEALQLSPGGNPCIATIDEVRVLEKAVSADWVALEHRNLDPEAEPFVTLGPLETQ